MKTDVNNGRKKQKEKLSGSQKIPVAAAQTASETDGM
jgi:hypothetical protein